MIKRFLIAPALVLALAASPAWGAARKAVVVGPAGTNQQIQAGDSLVLQAPANDASIVLPPGSAPSAPSNGGLWTTSGGLYARINGATVGPFGLNSPAGSNGQLQFNNAGAFGAFTLAGDCTLAQPSISCTKTGGVAFAPSATIDTTSAGNITSGVLSPARLPNPSASTLGGVESLAPAPHQFLTGLSTLGAPSAAQPACGDLSNGGALCPLGVGAGLTSAGGNLNVTNSSPGSSAAGDVLTFSNGTGGLQDSGTALSALLTSSAAAATYAAKANNLSDLASAATARGNLGLGSAAVLNAGVSVANPGTGALEALLPVQTLTGASHVFVTADLFRKTRRSNAGAAMADTLPAAAATGVVNGSRVEVLNVDASASIALTAGAGTTVSSGCATVGPGRDELFVYDATNTAWRSDANSCGAVLGANNLSDLSSSAAALANLGGAPLNSPALTGVPTAPTQAGTDNSTDLATDAFVHGYFCILTGCSLSGPLTVSGSGTSNFTNTTGQITANFNRSGGQGAIQLNRTDQPSAGLSIPLYEINFGCTDSANISLYCVVINTQMTNTTTGLVTGGLSIAAEVVGQVLTGGTISGGGAGSNAGYVANEVVTLSNNDGSASTYTPAVIKVTSVDGGGGVLTFVVPQGGLFVTLPTGFTQSATTGVGAGFALTSPTYGANQPIPFLNVGAGAVTLANGASFFQGGNRIIDAVGDVSPGGNLTLGASYATRWSDAGLSRTAALTLSAGNGTAGTTNGTFQATNFIHPSTLGVDAWNNPGGTALDTGFSRLSPGFIALGNGSALDFSGSLKLTSLVATSSITLGGTSLTSAATTPLGALSGNIPTNGANLSASLLTCTNASSLLVSCAAPAKYTASPSNPTGTTSTTKVMAGLAGSFTPARSGTFVFTIRGDSANSTANDGCSSQLSFGTGTAPVNGAALTGTQTGSAMNGTSTTAQPFNLYDVVSGLVAGTTYWLDEAFAAITGGTCSQSNLRIAAVEIG